MFHQSLENTPSSFYNINTYLGVTISVHLWVHCEQLTNEIFTIVGGVQNIQFLDSYFCRAVHPHSTPLESFQLKVTTHVNGSYSYIRLLCKLFTIFQIEILKKVETF
jgi:hypothetical protein